MVAEESRLGAGARPGRCGHYDRRVDAATLLVSLGDGRSLEVWASDGDAPAAVVLHMGTPCAGLPFQPLVEAVTERGARFVTYSRPGYAGSSRDAGRTVSGCAADVQAIAAALGLERLHVAGWSGGGPHALACAALLPDLVASAATIAGVAPWPADGLDWLAGMGPENVAEFGAAESGSEALVAQLEPFRAAMAAVTGAQVAGMLGGLVSDVDRAALTGAFAEFQARTFRAAVASGLWGWHDDDRAFVGDWGFELSQIVIPVSVWQGGEDRMVPFAHGEWLAAHVPGSRAHLFPDEGHLSLGVTRFAEIVDDLLAVERRL